MGPLIHLPRTPKYAAVRSRVTVCGGGGFIGSHLAKRLHDEGHWVRVVDWKRNEYFEEVRARMELDVMHGAL